MLPGILRCGAGISGTFFGLSLTFTTSWRWSGLAANFFNASSMRILSSTWKESKSFFARLENMIWYKRSQFPGPEYFIVTAFFHNIIKRVNPACLEICNSLFHSLDLFRSHRLIIIRGFSQTADNIIVRFPGIQFQVIQKRFGVCPHPHGSNFYHIPEYMHVYADKDISR